MSLNGRRSGSWVGVTGILIAVVMLATASFAGIAGAQSATPSPTAKTTFIYGSPTSNSSLNPLVGYLGVDYNIWAMEYNLPIEFGTKDFAPDYEHSIVTSVDTSPDNLTFTYHMRSGMKWSDGQPFTANDVVWTLNFYKERNISNYALDLAIFKDASVVNDTTFEIHSLKPTSVYSGDSVFMYDFILPEHIWSTLDEPKKFDDVPAVGSGPFIVKEYKPGDFVRLERNPNYWGTQVGLTPHVDEVIYKVFNDENQMAAALQSGEIDFIWGMSSASILNTLKTKPNIETRGAVQPSFEELALNTGSAFQTNPTGGFVPHGNGSHAVADPAFRRALRQAVDNQTIVDKVLLGYGVPADSPVQPTATTGNWDPPPDEALTFDLDKAKADLTAAGYTDTDGDGIVNDPKTGENVVLHYYIRTSDQNTIKTAPFVQSWWKEIGVGVKIEAVSNAKASSINVAGNLDLYDWGWYPNPDPNYILGVFTCEQRPPKPGVYGNNDSYFCDPEYDKLYEQQLTATSTQERVDIVHRMQQILYEQQPYITLYYDQNLEAWRTDRFTGYIAQPSPDGDMLAFYGPFSIINIRPVAAGAGGTTKSEGIPGWVWIGIVLVGLAVVIGGIMLGRRRVSDEDRA
jgi:peptide/nickel transport system substrate-binding protein